jgi:hypothetical protein
MLGPLKALLGGRTVVLASASPRRRQLLQDIVCVATAYQRCVDVHTTNYVVSSQNFPVKVVPSQFEETLDKEAFPQPWR